MYTDEQVNRYLTELENQFLPRFQEKVGDASPEMAERYRAYLRDHYRLDLMTDDPDISDEQEQLEKNFEFCCYLESESLRMLSAAAMLQHIEIPERSEEIDHAIGKLASFIRNAARLVFAVILGKVTPNPDDLQNQIDTFYELVRAVPKGQRWVHPMLPRSLFAVSDTVGNLCCAYGARPLWTAPIYREYDGLREAGPMNEDCYRGLLNLCLVDAFVNHTELRMPEDPDGKWMRALKERNRELIDGDWCDSEMPADIRQAWDYYEEHYGEGMEDSTASS